MTKKQRKFRIWLLQAKLTSVFRRWWRSPLSGGRLSGIDLWATKLVWRWRLAKEFSPKVIEQPPDKIAIAYTALAEAIDACQLLHCDAGMTYGKQSDLPERLRLMRLAYLNLADSVKRAQAARKESVSAPQKMPLRWLSNFDPF